MDGDHSWGASGDGDRTSSGSLDVTPEKEPSGSTSVALDGQRTQLEGSHTTRPTESIHKPGCPFGPCIIYLGRQRGHSPTGVPGDDYASDPVRVLRVVHVQGTPTIETSLQEQVEDCTSLDANPATGRPNYHGSVPNHRR